MSAAAEGAPARPQAFSGPAVLALVIVGVVAFAGLAVLSAYAPDLRGSGDVRPHALSRSAVGFAGAVVLARELGMAPVVSRSRPHDLARSVLVVTPDLTASRQDFERLPKARRMLIVLPKWQIAPDPLRRGHVRHAGVVRDASAVSGVLRPFAPSSRLEHRAGAAQPVLRWAGSDEAVRPGRVERLGTVSGDGWVPLLVDETGRAVLARSKVRPQVWVLADPDLLNNQGLGKLETARAGVAVLRRARAGAEGPLIFDVTLNGFERGRGLGRMMLEPPWLAATLVGVAAALLMGVHALARFGPTQARGRAFALGARALVDNSAGLVRMARKEHELAPAYAALTNGLAARAAGSHADEAWLEELAGRRGATAPSALLAEARAARTRDETLSIARKLYRWRREMMREHR